MWMPRSLPEKRVGGNGLVAVAIDRDKSSQIALKWAIDNLLVKGQTVILIHVNLKSSLSSHSSSPRAKKQMVEKTHICCRKENSQTIHADEEPQKRHEEENSQKFCILEKPHGFHAEEECQESQVQENNQTCRAEGKIQTIHAEHNPQESCAEEEP